jgi:phytoene dehydrogenase-like protein
MSEKFDGIIIGGGLGGLTCGAKLSHEGMKVLLIEQHNVPGGCATTFRHGGFNIEVGLHEMDGFDGGNLKNKIFRELGVFDHVQFIPTGAFYRFVHNGLDITVPHDPAEAIALFSGKFPDQAEGIRSYFDRIINYRKYRQTGSQVHKSLGEYLDSLFTDEEIKLALTGNLMAFSDDPYNISLDYFAQAQGSFHNSSGVFIRNGSRELSDYLLRYIRNHGGQVLLRHRADQIVTSGGGVSGVSYHPVNQPETSLFAGAGFVVANASVLNVVNTMVFHPEVPELYRSFEVSPSMFTLYLCFRNSLKNLGNQDYCTGFFPSEIRSLKDLSPSNKSGFEKKQFVLTDYSQIDSGLAPEGKGFAVIVCTDYAGHWRERSKEDYVREKERVARVLISRLEQHIPGASEHIEYYDAATPLTIERYTSNPAGAIYGFAQTPGRGAMPDITGKIPNLFVASAWDKFGGGFSGAIYSGYFTGIEILRNARKK